MFVCVCVWFYCRNRVVDVECHLISGAFSLSLEKYLEDNIIFRRDFFKSWSKKTWTILEKSVSDFRWIGLMYWSFKSGCSIDHASPTANAEREKLAFGSFEMINGVRRLLMSCGYDESRGFFAGITPHHPPTFSLYVYVVYSICSSFAVCIRPFSGWLAVCQEKCNQLSSSSSSPLCVALLQRLSSSL